MADVGTEFRAMTGDKAAQAALAEESNAADTEQRDSDAKLSSDEGKGASSEAADEEVVESSSDGAEDAETGEAEEEAAEVGEEEEEAAPDPRDETIRQLSTRLEALEGRKPAEEPSVSLEISDDEYANAMESKEAFQALLLRAMKEARVQGREEALTMLPELAQKEVDATLTIRESVREFWDRNKDLSPYKRMVGFVTAELQAAHPEWDLAKLLKETEKKARIDLKHPRVKEKKAAVAVNQGEAKPAFTSGTSARVEKKPLTKIQTEFNEMAGKRTLR